MEKRKILFIDDNEALLKWIKLALERTGKYEVAVEQSGKSGLSTARSFKPEMVFIDITMPDIEGSAVAREMVSDPLFSKVPIIFLTGAISQAEAEHTGGKIGGQYFLAKPVELRQLISCIEKHLGS